MTRLGERMLKLLRRRRERLQRIDAEADELIRVFGIDAYSEARRRAIQASSGATVDTWNKVALAVAHKTGKRVGLDTSTRMAADADFSPDRKSAEARPRARSSPPRPLDELKRILSER